MRKFEVLEKRIELEAVERTPWTSQVLPGFSLLPRVVVEQKLKNKSTLVRQLVLPVSLNRKWP